MPSVVDYRPAALERTGVGKHLYRLAEALCWFRRVSVQSVAALAACE